MSLRDKILTANNLTPVEVPEWGKVYLRHWSIGERVVWGKLAADKDISHDVVQARAIILSLCDADGKRLFTDDDVELVLSLDSQAADVVCKAAFKANGLVPEADDIADAKKNSSPTQVSTSSSSSHLT